MAGSAAQATGRWAAELRAALREAETLARGSGPGGVEAEHLLLAVLAVTEGACPSLLARLGVAPAELRARLERELSGTPAGTCAGTYDRRAEPAGRCDPVATLLDAAEREAEAQGEPVVTCAHLLLALSQWPGGAAEGLRRAGLTHGRLAEALQSAPRATSGLAPARPVPYTRDLTALAVAGELDPVAARERTIDRAVGVLARRTKNHPLLLGSPGVGKTAVVEGLAQRIAVGAAPRFLARRRVLALDLAALVAGARYRGDLEERVVRLVEALAELGDEALLFVDEIHLLVAADGGAGHGAAELASLLKPALARGGLACIGATTVEDYRRHLARDPAFERRFQPVLVEEPDAGEARAMLEALRPRYEAHHQVRFADGALHAAVRLTARCLPDRRLPDKAIDALDEAAARLRLARESDPGVGAVVDEEAVARVVGEWSGVPVARLLDDERSRLRALEEELGRRIVGQDEAIARVAAAVRRARVGLGDPRRPLGAFLFVGPPGVGKTALARALASWLLGDEAALVRLDLAEYGERHAAARLVGAPPGYLGYGEGGQLTEAVRRRPHAVVLLDEVDKAHPEVRAALLPVLDEGRLTDGQGRTADFRHAILILTANQPGELRPELLDRLDEVVTFRPLGRAARRAIAALGVAEVAARAAEQGIALHVEEPALDRLAEAGAEGEGVRPLRRALRRLVEDPLVDRLLAGALAPGDRVRLTIADGALAWEKG